MKDSNSTELLWISSSFSDAPTDRSKMRREVMQKVALRRRKEPKRHHPNSRQLPIFVTNDGVGESTANQEHNRKYDEMEAIDKDSHLELVILDSDVVYSDDTHSQTTLMPLPDFPCTYPSMISKCNLDFPDLSLLASYEVGRYTGQRLLERPRSISHFLGGKNWSYCHYVPFHYSRSSLVRNATDSVVARVRCLLSPNTSNWESLAVASYSTALSILQEAINSTSERPSAEILCATEILGLYEMLNPHRQDAWKKHAAGASCIIKLRGPDSYGSDFEKSLLMSHVGPIITESILDNQICFLDQPAWTAVLRSVITDNPLVPERSTMVISLLIILISIPGIFRDITAAICDYPPPPPTTLIELITKAQNLRLSLRNWFLAYVGLDEIPVSRLSICDGYYKIRVLFYISSIYSNRLNTCIYRTGASDVMEMEEESQRYANIIVSLYREEAYANLPSSLLLAHKLPIAEAIIESGDNWKEELRSSSGSRDQLFKMPAQTFKNWCALFGRKTS